MASVAAHPFDGNQDAISRPAMTQFSAKNLRSAKESGGAH